MFTKILSVALALLYFGTTTGFGVVRCNMAGQAKVILPNAKIENCVCSAHEQVAATENNDCCANESSINDLYSNISEIVSENSDNGSCCALSFQKLDVQFDVVSKVNDSKSTNYNTLFFPVAIIQTANFVFGEDDIIFQKKPSHIAQRGRTALIYQYCKLRN
ncbi:MAG: hypothetical protein LBB41_03755 [Prevotellaceae bacterium]|nr:hypothetical protein [Prevotellaceae bacterium]